jgi:hypothetical protein
MLKHKVGDVFISPINEFYVLFSEGQESDNWHYVGRIINGVVPQTWDAAITTDDLNTWTKSDIAAILYGE